MLGYTFFWPRQAKGPPASAEEGLTGSSGYLSGYTISFKANFLAYYSTQYNSPFWFEPPTPGS